MLYNVILTTYQFPRIPLKLAELHKKFTNLKTAVMLPPFGDGFPYTFTIILLYPEMGISEHGVSARKTMA